MISDTSIERKCVHLKIRRAIHNELRRILLPRELSMQEVFDYFAEEVASGVPAALSILNRAGAKKLRRKLGELKTKKPSKLRVKSQPELGTFEDGDESMYALISDGMQTFDADDPSDADDVDDAEAD